jgi:hypothetical protein
VIHYVPDPVELDEPVVADLFFVGCEYTEVPALHRIKFEMRSDHLTMLFIFDREGLLRSLPSPHFGNSDEVWQLLINRHGSTVSWGDHVTHVDEGVDAGPTILEHLEYWLGSSMNIEIDLSELRRSAI